jgi:hypothetical protein
MPNLLDNPKLQLVFMSFKRILNTPPLVPVLKSAKMGSNLSIFTKIKHHQPSSTPLQQLKNTLLDTLQISEKVLITTNNSPQECLPVIKTKELCDMIFLNALKGYDFQTDYHKAQIILWIS